VLFACKEVIILAVAGSTSLNETECRQRKKADGVLRLMQLKRVPKQVCVVSAHILINLNPFWPERAILAKKNAELAVSQRWKAAQRAAFAYASVDAALARQRTAAAAQLEAEALQRAAADNAAAEAEAAAAAAAAERFQMMQERALAREQQIGRAKMLERQYQTKLLLRCRNTWLNFVVSSQHQKREATFAAETKMTHIGAASSEPSQSDSDDDVPQSSMPRVAEDLIQTSSAINVMEESIFKRVFNNNMQEAENVLGDSAPLSEIEVANERAGEQSSSRIPSAVMISPQAEPEFNNLGRSTLELSDTDHSKSPAWNIGNVAPEQADDATSEEDQEDVAIDINQRRSPVLKASQLQEEILENSNDFSTGHFQQLLSHHQSVDSLLESQSNSELVIVPQFTRPVSSPSSSNHAQVLTKEDSFSAYTAHDGFIEQHLLDPKMHLSPPLSVQVRDDAVVSAPAPTSDSDGLVKPAPFDVEPSFTVAKTRTGPKTPLSPPLSVHVRDDAAVSASAPTSDWDGLVKPAVAKSKVAVAETCNDPKASHPPFATDIGMTVECRLVQDEISVDTADSAATSVPQQQLAFFKIGPKTPLTPAAPTRHVRQWLVRHGDEVQPQEIEMNVHSKLPEQLFIRRSVKPPTVFLENPLQPSFTNSSARDQFSKTDPPLLQADSIVSGRTPDNFLPEGDASMQPLFSWTGASLSGKQRLVRNVDQSSFTSMQRLPQGARNLPAAQSASTLPNKHPDKSDAFSFHRAEMFRELDNALRIQWPHSFQKVATVSSLSVRRLLPQAFSNFCAG
jgi:hypothetical protein